MKRTVLLLAIIASALIPTSCNKPYDTVFSTWPNGAKKLVLTVIDNQDGKTERIGEKMFYDNGRQMYEKHYKNDKPTGEWKYWYDNGQLHAKGNFDTNDSTGSDWVVYNREGKVFHEEAFDSMKVLQFTADHRPLTLSYYSGDSETRYQFNENYTLNAKGMMRNGKKEGRWEFFYANGQKMLEATYNDDVENGAYNSYRENGVPYFIGFYINGQRANVWEIYDEAGNLVARQDYDKH